MSRGPKSDSPLLKRLLASGSIERASPKCTGSHFTWIALLDTTFCASLCVAAAESCLMMSFGRSLSLMISLDCYSRRCRSSEPRTHRPRQGSERGTAPVARSRGRYGCTQALAAALPGMPSFASWLWARPGRTEPCAVETMQERPPLAQGVPKAHGNAWSERRLLRPDPLEILRAELMAGLFS